MNFKRALWIALLVYGISFIVGSLILVFSGLDLTQVSDVPDIFLYVNILVTVILAVLFTMFYFKDKKVKRNAKEGFYFGLVLILVGFILDIVIFSLGSLASESSLDLLDYYSNPIFWLSLVLIIVTATVVGAIKGRK